jgi:hypothetical protein
MCYNTAAAAASRNSIQNVTVCTDPLFVATKRDSLQLGIGLAAGRTRLAANWSSWAGTTAINKRQAGRSNMSNNNGASIRRPGCIAHMTAQRETL